MTDRGTRTEQRKWVCLIDGRTAPIEVKAPACPECGRKMVAVTG